VMLFNTKGSIHSDCDKYITITKRKEGQGRASDDFVQLTCNENDLCVINKTCDSIRHVSINFI